VVCMLPQILARDKYLQQNYVPQRDELIVDIVDEDLFIMETY